MFLPFLVLLLIHEVTPQGQFEYILPLLNNYRTNIATGQAWKHRGMLPSSSKMFALKYDSFLELYAQYNTAGCETSNMIPPGGSMNFYKIYGLPTDYDNATVVPLAFATWTQPVLRHEIDDQITYANTNLETFANMAYYKSTHVGCAYQACPTSQPPAHAVACVFDSAPTINELLYVASGYGLSNGCNDGGDCGSVYDGAFCRPEGLCGL